MTPHEQRILNLEVPAFARIPWKAATAPAPAGMPGSLGTALPLPDRYPDPRKKDPNDKPYPGPLPTKPIPEKPPSSPPKKPAPTPAGGIGAGDTIEQIKTFFKKDVFKVAGYQVKAWHIAAGLAGLYLWRKK